MTRAGWRGAAAKGGASKAGGVVVAVSGLLGAAWAGCDADDEPVRCDEAFGYVCQKGSAGASGEGGGGPGGASGTAGTGGTAGLGGGGAGGGNGGSGGLACGALKVDFEGRGRVEGFRLEGTTLYAVTLQAGALTTWRKAEGDVEPFLLGKVAAKAAGYAGNPFGAAYVLADEAYVYVATSARSTPARTSTRARAMGWSSAWRRRRADGRCPTVG